MRSATETNNPTLCEARADSKRVLGGCLMRCIEVMNKVECCFVDDSVAHVAGRMCTRHVGFLPVCNDHGQ